MASSRIIVSSSLKKCANVKSGICLVDNRARTGTCLMPLLFRRMEGTSNGPPFSLRLARLLLPQPICFCFSGRFRFLLVSFVRQSRLARQTYQTASDNISEIVVIHRALGRPMTGTLKKHTILPDILQTLALSPVREIRNLLEMDWRGANSWRKAGRRSWRNVLTN